MTMEEALKIIGINPTDYFMKLSFLTRKERIVASTSMLAEAKKRAKHLMAKHHPDKGGDIEQFKIVNSSIMTIEKETERFVTKMTKIIADAEEREQSKIRIVLGG
jgi:hypothetical protein